jgi:hypothetical protein
MRGWMRARPTVAAPKRAKPSAGMSDDEQLAVVGAVAFALLGVVLGVTVGWSR